MVLIAKPFNKDGNCTLPEALKIGEAAESIIAAGYRKPRIVSTVEELDALPTGSVIRNPRHGDVFTIDHGPHGNWHGGSTRYHGIGDLGMNFMSEEIDPWLPYEVLYTSREEQ